MIAVMILAWCVQGKTAGEWPALAWLLFTGMIVAGVLLCCFALMSSDKTVKKRANASGTHEGEILVAIVAAPVYWIGRQIQRPGTRR